MYDWNCLEEYTSTISRHLFFGLKIISCSLGGLLVTHPFWLILLWFSPISSLLARWRTLFEAQSWKVIFILINLTPTKSHKLNTSLNMVIILHLNLNYSCLIRQLPIYSVRQSYNQRPISVIIQIYTLNWWKISEVSLNYLTLVRLLFLSFHALPPIRSEPSIQKHC